MPHVSYWRREGTDLIPAPAARSPWNRELVHGRLLSALAARAVEREHGDPDFQCARLTVDLFRAAPFAPVSITTEPVRRGGRVRVVSVEVVSRDTIVASASAVLLRRGEQPATGAWRAPEWDVSLPDELPIDGTPEGTFLGNEVRPITPGGFLAPGRKQLWLRELAALVEGEEWTPLTRAAAVSDLANALASSGEEPNRFINADVTLQLGRLPRGEWLGLEVGGHVSGDGVAVGRCDLYDTSGRVGWATYSAVASPTQLDVRT